MSFSFPSFPSFTSFTSNSPPLNSSIPTNSNNNNSAFLYCERKIGQVLELNPQNQQLNLILNSPTFTPSQFLYTIKSCPEKPTRMLCNKIGSLVAIKGSTGNLCVLRLSGSSSASASANAAAVVASVVEEIEIITSTWNVSEIVGMAWHPASPADNHLVLLTKQGRLLIYDILQAKPTIYEDSSITVTTTTSTTTSTSLLHLNSPEQDIKLPFNRSDPFAGIVFSFFEADPSMASWSQFSAVVVKESGDLFLLCPLLPLQFRARRKGLLLPLLNRSADASARKWLEDVLRGCEFVSGPAGDTDWVLARNPAAFEHLQPRLQGPLLIQPEPLEISHLSAFDRISDFSIVHVTETLEVGVLAFGSGKVDLVALPSVDFAPIFQLKSEKEIGEAGLIAALLESIDLKAATLQQNQKRSVNYPLKIHQIRLNQILLSTDDSVVAIELKISLNDNNNCDRGDCDESFNFDCKAQILIDGLKKSGGVGVKCISNDQIYPGSIKLPDQARDDETEFGFVTAPCPILDSISKYAFQMDRLEIETGAQQLEGLVENLMKNLNRLKQSPGAQVKSSCKLDAGIDEVAAIEFNDRVLEWQEGLVSPALRVSHEIFHRSNHLAALLQREREILVRARGLLLSKPQRLEALMAKIAEAHKKHAKISERVDSTLKQLSKLSGGDENGGLQNRLSSQLSRIIDQFKKKDDFIVLNGKDEDGGGLVEAQLRIQSEILNKLKLKLGTL